MRLRAAVGQMAMVLAAAAVLGLPAVAAVPASLLPATNTVKGWKRVGAPKQYNAANLFDLIDGEAQAVEAYTFASEAHAEYAPMAQSRPSMTVDVFDMGNPLNAFGLFSSEQVGGRPVPVGAGGSLAGGGTGLTFWKGRYDVRIAYVGHSAAERAAVLLFGRAVAARITGKAGPPPILAALPPGRAPRTDKYVRENVEGHNFLSNAVVARYPTAGFFAELFIAAYGSPAAAHSALAKYMAAEKGGQGLAPLKGVGQAGFHVNDRFVKNIVVAQKGRFLVGVVRAKSLAAAVTLVKQAVARVHA